MSYRIDQWDSVHDSSPMVQVPIGSSEQGENAPMRLHSFHSIHVQGTHARLHNTSCTWNHDDHAPASVGRWLPSSSSSGTSTQFTVAIYVAYTRTAWVINPVLAPSSDEEPIQVSLAALNVGSHVANVHVRSNQDCKGIVRLGPVRRERVRLGSGHALGPCR